MADNADEEGAFDPAVIDPDINNAEMAGNPEPPAPAPAPAPEQQQANEANQVGGAIAEPVLPIPPALPFLDEGIIFNQDDENFLGVFDEIINDNLIPEDQMAILAANIVFPAIPAAAVEEQVLAPGTPEIENNDGAGAPLGEPGLVQQPDVVAFDEQAGAAGAGGVDDALQDAVYYEGEFLIRTIDVNDGENISEILRNLAQNSNLSIMRASGQLSRIRLQHHNQSILHEGQFGILVLSGGFVHWGDNIQGVASVLGTRPNNVNLAGAVAGELIARGLVRVTVGLFSRRTKRAGEPEVASTSKWLKIS